MPPSLQEHSALLCALARAASDHPTADKLLVCQPRGVGRELLHTLARAGQPWLGFRAQTPRDLAKQLATPALVAEGLVTIDGFEELALLDEAIDAVLARPVGKALAELGNTVGFRNALQAAVRDMRLAGLDASAVTHTRLEDHAKGRALAAIQEAYEKRLRSRDAVDLADVLRHAVIALGDDGPLPAARVYIVSGMSLRGLRGALLEALIRGGAEVLPTDPVEGLERPDTVLAAPPEPPAATLSFLYATERVPNENAPRDLFTPGPVEPVHLELFAAASPVDELREVLRRVMAARVPWDDVEIIATDRIVYGTALDSIAPQLVQRGDGSARVTHAAGLPVARTRVGRAVNGYLRWIGEGFPEDVLRGMLQSGLLKASDGEHELTGSRAAGLLRTLRIGWGRERYLRQVDWAIEGIDRPPDEREQERLSAEELTAHRARRLRELRALRALLAPLLEATPATPDRLGADAVEVSPAALARGVARMLDFVPTPDEPDTEHEAKRRLLEVLARAADTLERDTDFPAAVAILARFLDLRVPSPSSFGRVPWSSAGGYLHFTDIDHGGLSARPWTFVVGLDASRFPGLGGQDALLLDSDRARLSAALPLSAEVIDERRWALAAMLARLRGHVTLSYSAWDASEGRNLSPAPVLLQALRLRDDDATASYQQLHTATRPIRGPVPASDACIDDVDLWLHALEDDGVLRPGVAAVRAEFAGLDAGLTARELRRNGQLNAHKGIVAARPERFDPRRVGADLLLSASRLETLAGCPLRYLFGYVLRLKPPDQIRFEADRWLDSLERGSMFHQVYERIIKQAIERGVCAPSDELDAIAEAAFADAIDDARFRVPVPSQAVFERELRELRGDLDVFLGMLVQEDVRWLATEWSFGFPESAQQPIELKVGGGSAWLRGAVDRIDELPDGGLAIVDYKTGSPYMYGEATGTYKGGARLQHALYAAAVEQGMERDVERAAYHFPTRRGRGDRVAYARDRLDRWPFILEQLFDMIGAGWFPPPFDDNPPCKICDFQSLCRVNIDRWGKLDAPPVTWAQDNNHLKPEYAPLQRIRKIDDEEER
ncbi:MAG: PD-(D/E)XK nuclease family protein [Acidobacteriota bacterium]